MKTFVDWKRKKLQKKPDKRRKVRSFTVEFTKTNGRTAIDVGSYVERRCRVRLLWQPPCNTW